MTNPTSRDDVQHMPDEATPEQDASRKDRKQTGPRDLPQQEQIAGAPTPEERDTPKQRERSSD